MTRLAALFATLALCGCSPHPDLSLPDEEFDKKYFPEHHSAAVEYERQAGLARGRAAGGGPDGAVLYQKQLEETYTRLAADTRHATAKARGRVRAALGRR